MKAFLYVCFTLIICLVAQTGYAQSRLDFTSEDLVFSLYGNVWKVNGEYVFSNYSTETITQKIYFPIPSDASSSAAQDISLKLRKPLPGQSYKLMEAKPQGFWFELTLPAKTIATCNIRYWQQLRGTKAKYILLTANSWGKPLETAKYTLIVSNKLRIKTLPFPNPVVKQKWFHIRYIWEYTNYSPESDFVVESKDFLYK